MPFGYLLTGLLWVFGALCAVAPLRRPAVAAWTCFFVGFVINELPYLGLYYLAVATWLAFADGALSNAGGWVSLAVAALAATALAVAWVRATRAGAVVDRALVDGLGAGWRDQVDPQTRAGLQAGFAVRVVSFLPMRVRRRDVVRVKNISYGDAGRHNRLDAYHHRSRPSGCPTLVHFHGGGLQTGTKNREALALIYRLARRGWVCISANYRVGADARFPDHLVDVKRVIAWVRAQGPMYGGDGSTVVVAGGSAGAQLASLAALTANDPRYQPGFEGADTSVTAAVALYGLFGSTSIRDHGNDVEREDLPAAHLRADAPPFFVSHGDLDTLLRVEGARDFVRALRAVSRNPVVYAELPGAHHAFDRFRSVRCDNVVNGIESFVAWVRATEARSPAR